MFLDLKHKQLEVYKAAKLFSAQCYKATLSLPADEKLNMVQQIRRAALSVVLNLAEGCSRKSEVERKRFFEIARGSVIEIDAAFEVANELGYLRNYDFSATKELANKTFSMLSRLIAI